MASSYLPSLPRASSGKEIKSLKNAYYQNLGDARPPQFLGVFSGSPRIGHKSDCEIILEHNTIMKAFHQLHKARNNLTGEVKLRPASFFPALFAVMSSVKHYQTDDV